MNLMVKLQKEEAQPPEAHVTLLSCGTVRDRQQSHADIAAMSCNTEILQHYT